MSGMIQWFRPASTPVEQLRAVAGSVLPGRWLGAAGALLGPACLLAGLLLRAPFDFFFPAQLRAYDDHPVVVVWSSGLFTTGILLLVPAVMALSASIGVRQPTWALFGGALALAGLGARLFHAGVDHLAFQLVDLRGYRAAHDVVADSYLASYALETANPMHLAGWLVLAVGCARARTFGGVQCLGLGAMAFLMIGVLKGTSAASIAIVVALCLVLVPYGVQLIRVGEFPGWQRVCAWSAVTTATLALMVFLGQAG